MIRDAQWFSSPTQLFILQKTIFYDICIEFKGDSNLTLNNYNCYVKCKLFLYVSDVILFTVPVKSLSTQCKINHLPMISFIMAT
jgi:hypothetical protein